MKDSVTRETVREGLLGMRTGDSLRNYPLMSRNKSEKQKQSENKKKSRKEGGREGGRKEPYHHGMCDLQVGWPP